MEKDCAVTVDKFGRISPHAAVIEFRVGSFAARLCDGCAAQLRDLLKKETA